MKYILLIFILVSCNSTKQAARHLNKAFKKDAALVARVTRDSFPCTELLKTDTTFVVTDSTVYVECPDYSNISDTMHDTLRSQIFTPSGINSKGNAAFIPKRVQIKVPVKTMYVNRWFEDSAKIKLANNDLSKIGKSRDEYKGKAQRRGKLILWLFVAVAILTASNVLTLRKIL
jgi:hypothetical protein